MALHKVTSREFRAAQASFFTLADKGDKILIKRGKRRSYILTPVEDTEDLYFTPEMLAKIDRSLQEVKDGKFKTFETKESMHAFLENL